MISEQHRQRYRVHYGKGEFRARDHLWRGEVDALVKQHAATSVLDYGCGPSRSLSKFAPYPVADYDPAVAGVDGPPSPADIVVCNHVLEHVEPEQLAAVVAHLQQLTQKALYLAVSCQPAPGKVLFDGTPWHTIVQPPSWWEAFLGEFFPAARSRAENNAFIMVWTNGSSSRR